MMSAQSEITTNQGSQFRYIFLPLQQARKETLVQQCSATLHLLNMLSTTCHVYFGKVMGATPNGRLAEKAISDGTSPSHGADTHGPSAVIKSLGKLDQVKSGGTLLNQRFLPSLLKREEDNRKTFVFKDMFLQGGKAVGYCSQPRTLYISGVITRSAVVIIASFGNTKYSMICMMLLKANRIRKGSVFT